MKFFFHFSNLLDLTTYLLVNNRIEDDDMIRFFEQQTAPLTEYEKDVLLPLMVKGLSHKVGKDNAVTNDVICEKLTDKGYQIGPARVRKLINYIRLNSLINCLMATSYGYYITKEEKEMKEYIKSLEGRIAAIQAVKDIMECQLQELIEDNEEEEEEEEEKKHPLS